VAVSRAAEAKRNEEYACKTERTAKCAARESHSEDGESGEDGDAAGPRGERECRRRVKEENDAGDGGNDEKALFSGNEGKKPPKRVRLSEFGRDRD
jgi:hypothetical protein